MSRKRRIEAVRAERELRDLAEARRNGESLATLHQVANEIANEFKYSDVQSHLRRAVMRMR